MYDRFVALKPVNRQVLGYYSLFIDQMKKLGVRLVFLNSIDKNFARDEGNA